MATLFLALLDSGRFFGRNRDKDVSHQVDAADLMRRFVKEELVKFDGTPLFPERILPANRITASSARSRRTRMDMIERAISNQDWPTSAWMPAFTSQCTKRGEKFNIGAVARS